MSSRAFVVLMVLSILFATPTLLSAADQTLRISYAFSSPEVADSADGTILNVSGLTHYLRPGRPVVPMRTAMILLPQGTAPDDVQVVPESKITLPGNYELRTTRHPLPISGGRTAPPTFNDPETTGIFPGVLYEKHSVQRLRGARILVLNLFPVQYDVDRRTVTYYEKLHVEVALAEDAGDAEDLPYRGLSRDIDLIAETVDNWELLTDFVSQTPPPEAEYDYTIITHSTLSSAAASYASWLQSEFGLAVNVQDVAGIYTGYPGGDYPDRIRRYLSDAYSNQSVEYVLLLGDCDPEGTSLIPHRALYGNVDWWTIDEDIPGDLYYAALDGPYDNNGNGLYGESHDGTGGSEVDLLADISLGRIPANSPAEANFHLNKIKAHTAGTNHNKALLVGEQLDDWPTYGGDYKDWVHERMGGVAYTSLYERDGNFSTWAVQAQINSDGYDLLNHMGHSNNDYTIGLYRTNVLNNLNNDDPLLVYTQGCYSAAMDNRWDDGWYDNDDSVGEYFVTKNDSGAWAVIANSRYGWYEPGTVYGPSNYFDREFMEAVYHEGINRVGLAFNDQKNDLVGSIYSTGAERWVFFELNLLGCPYQEVLLDDQPDPPSITATAPQAGDVWRKGATQTIRWTMNNPNNWTIRASLYKGGVYEGRRLCDELPAGSTSCTYQVAEDIVNGDDYQVQVYFIGHGAQYQDFSDDFTITDPVASPEITVTAPQAGDVWVKGATVDISWDAENPEGWYIRASLFKGGAYEGRRLCDNLPANARTCEYTVAQDIVPGNDYQVQLYFIDHGAQYQDFSDEFTIRGQGDDDDDDDDDDDAADDDDTATDDDVVDDDVTDDDVTDDDDVVTDDDFMDDDLVDDDDNDTTDDDDQTDDDQSDDGDDDDSGDSSCGC